MQIVGRLASTTCGVGAHSRCTFAYGPLAWVIIGGLISSTLLSRVVTPVMYLLIVRGAVEARVQVAA